MVLTEILATFANPKIVSWDLYKMGTQCTHISRRYLLYTSTLKPVYSIFVLIPFYLFSTFLNPWKTGWVHRPRSIYSLSIIFVVLPESMAANWFCGHCSYGPMMVETHEYCVICHRQRDSYATYENLGPSFTASLNQPELRSSATHCGNRGPITYQQPTLEPEAEGLPAQETALALTRWYCCQGKKVKNIYYSYFFQG